MLPQSQVKGILVTYFYWLQAREINLVEWRGRSNRRVIMGSGAACVRFWMVGIALLS